MHIISTDTACPFEATYIALLRNIDGENAHTFAQETKQYCSEDNEYKTFYVLESVLRCANTKYIDLGPNWLNRMKELIETQGFTCALNTTIINDMVSIGYPYDGLRHQTQ
jgi:hypothetical protein